jgi:hypothetical protein
MKICSIGLAFAALAGLAAPELAQAQTPEPAAAEPPSPPDNAGTGGAPAAASDEDLEAAVLGERVAPARKPAAPASARPRAAMTSDAAVVAPAPAPARASGSREHRRAQRPDSGDVTTTGEPGDRLALALELDTAGLGSAALQGGIFVGARLGSGLILGGLLDYASSVASLTTTGATGSTTSQSTSTLRFGAGARMPVIRTEDGRVDLFIAGELGLVRGSHEVVGGPATSYNVSALGLTVAGGPGLRLWVHDHVAVGYAAQFRVTHLGGKAGAFPQLTTGTAPNTDASSTDLALEGAFQLLGVF